MTPCCCSAETTRRRRGLDRPRRVRAEPHEVLAALTDPGRSRRGRRRLRARGPGRARRCTPGSRERVCGSLAGVKAFFEVDVSCAELGRLELVATGPLAMDVGLPVSQAGRSRGRGRERRPAPPQRPDRQILRGAAAALLNAGALDRALQRLSDSLCRPARARARRGLDQPVRRQELARDRLGALLVEFDGGVHQPQRLGLSFALTVSIVWRTRAPRAPARPGGRRTSRSGSRRSSAGRCSSL